MDYKHATIKAYHNQGRALRTETTINNNTNDFDIGKRLVNLPVLREIGFHANRRLLDVQRLDHDPITGAHDLPTLTDPVTTDEGIRIPGLRLGQQRSHALPQGDREPPQRNRTYCMKTIAAPRDELDPKLRLRRN